MATNKSELEGKLAEIFSDAIQQRWGELEPMIMAIVQEFGTGVIKRPGEYLNRWEVDSRVSKAFNQALDETVTHQMATTYKPLVDYLAARVVKAKLKPRFDRRDEGTLFQEMLQEIEGPQE